jgi:hypothetical protein
MAEFFQLKDLGNVNECSGKTVECFLDRGKIVFDKTGIVEDEDLALIFNNMQAKSREGQYQTLEGRPLRFFHFPCEVDSLYNMMWGSKKMDLFLNLLAEFAATEPAYIDRFKKIQETTRELRNVDVSDPVKLIKSVFLDDLEHNSQKFSIKIIKLINRFANPESTAEATDYPMLVPIFNINWQNLDINAVHKALLDPALEQSPSRKRYLAISDLVDGFTYNTWDLKPAHLIVTAPLLLREMETGSGYGGSYFYDLHLQIQGHNPIQI